MRGKQQKTQYTQIPAFAEESRSEALGTDGQGN